jgi:N utilization substance protein B
MSEQTVTTRDDLPPDAVPVSPGSDAAPSTPAVAPNRRRQNRAAAMQFLYSWDISRPENTAESLRSFFTTQEKERKFYSFSEELANGVIEKLSDIDEVIRTYAQNWQFHRIAKVDLAVLRLAIYELLFRPDIPPVVTINEAIELSKAYSVPESKRFINGILDKLKDQLHRPAREAAGA